MDLMAILKRVESAISNINNGCLSNIPVYDWRDYNGDTQVTDCLKAHWDEITQGNFNVFVGVFQGGYPQYFTAYKFIDYGDDYTFIDMAYNRGFRVYCGTKSSLALNKDMYYKPQVALASNDKTRSTSVQKLTDVGVTVPPYSYYVATAQFFYNNAKPSIIGIGYDGGNNFDDTVYEYRNNSTLGVNHPKITTSGYTDSSSLTLCPFGSWSQANSNRASLQVLYWSYGSFYS